MRIHALYIQAFATLCRWPTLLALVTILSANVSSGAELSCLQQRDAVLKEKTKVEAHFSSVQAFRTGLTDAPKHQAAVEKAEQALAKDRDALAKIDERLRLYAPVNPIANQINETKRQLATLGFDDRSADFEQLGEMSAVEQAHIKKQLFEQFQGLVIESGTKAMEERFLEKIKKMKKRDVEVLANKLRRSGTDDPVFQEWLRSFSPAASRNVLVDGARDTIKYLKKEDNFLKMFEQAEPGTVEARQDAFLTLLSLVSDNPAIAELKAVAAGFYNVGEATVYLYVLQKNIGHLNNITEEQLERQKILMKRMEHLMRDLKQACANN